MSVCRGLIAVVGVAGLCSAASAQFVPLDLSGFTGSMPSISGVEVTVNSTNVAYDGQFLDGPLTSGTGSGDMWFAQHTQVQLVFSSPVIVALSQQNDFTFSATDEDRFFVSATGGTLSVVENEFGELSEVAGDGTSELAFSYTGLSGPAGSAEDRANRPWMIVSTAITSLTIEYDGFFDGNRSALNIAVTTVPGPSAFAALAGMGLLGARRRR
jgi:MYXO-CTERM domain-containing protein